ncbi:hypothetical protein Rsub_00184 [Raphidocelis subcapitata]|uniref:Uncharacterized protein n=1 Tax=Raphidocelis subcapitata TaxID=307507 RepID=A0A2V0NPN9_9CHLO|nr:hypothetical protein Rsub_00184 [Raphidocelis subcapitata]|eukprot:GBF87473.1 hypothetical protein Rsub_00184 [Raphidocelis subcapitata]
MSTVALLVAQSQEQPRPEAPAQPPAPAYSGVWDASRRSVVRAPLPPPVPPEDAAPGHEAPMPLGDWHRLRATLAVPPGATRLREAGGGQLLAQGLGTLLQHAKPLPPVGGSDGGDGWGGGSASAPASFNGSRRRSRLSMGSSAFDGGDHAAEAPLFEGSNADGALALLRRWQSQVVGDDALPAHATRPGAQALLPAAPARAARGAEPYSWKPLAAQSGAAAAPQTTAGGAAGWPAAPPGDAAGLPAGGLRRYSSGGGGFTPVPSTLSPLGRRHSIECIAQQHPDTPAASAWLNATRSPSSVAHKGSSSSSPRSAGGPGQQPAPQRRWSSGAAAGSGAPRPLPFGAEYAISELIISSNAATHAPGAAASSPGKSKLPALYGGARADGAPASPTTPQHHHHHHQQQQQQQPAAVPPAGARRASGEHREARASDEEVAPWLRLCLEEVKRLPRTAAAAGPAPAASGGGCGGTGHHAAVPR